jgi:hypothetical protein
MLLAAVYRRQTRPIARLMARYLGFAFLTPLGTLALLENEMGDVHLDRRQLNHSMGVIGAQGGPLAVTSRTWGWIDQVHLGGAEQGGASALVAVAPPAAAGGLAAVAFGLFVRRI